MKKDSQIKLVSGLRGKCTAAFCLFVVFACLPISAQQYVDYLGAGHNQGITVTSSDDNGTSSGSHSASGVGLNGDFNSTARFLLQATMGADYETIQAVQSMGITQWIENQMQIQASDYYAMTEEVVDYRYNLLVAGGASEDDLEYGSWPYFWTFTDAWWQITITEDDLLRQKVAYALSQIFVISSDSDLYDYGLGFGDYYNMLMEHSFGNFRDLLMDVTRHPMMGFYLSHLNNAKTNTVLGTRPDENYAREIMQLFTIGLYELNIDGTQVLDANGNAIPTYDNDDIKEFAKIFTGFSGPEFFGQDLYGFEDLRMPMVMYDEEHESGTKNLLNGYVVPAGQTGMQDVNNAIAHLFNHPNVGPFIGRLLIQRLVKSNPTSEYVARVARTFNDNGSGERGDMAAVVKAILLDSEARDCAWIDVSASGKLQEPFLRYVHILRALNASNTSNRYYADTWGLQANLQQNVLSAKTVFNFYLPDYSPNGLIKDLGLVAPEFQITNSITSIGYANEAFSWTMWGNPMGVYIVGDQYLSDPDAFYNDLQVSFDLEYEQSIANDEEALVDRLDEILCYGEMSENTKSEIVASIEQIWEGDQNYKVLTALYLTLISPDYVKLD